MRGGECAFRTVHPGVRRVRIGAAHEGGASSPDLELVVKEGRLAARLDVVQVRDHRRGALPARHRVRPATLRPEIVCARHAPSRARGRHGGAGHTAAERHAH
eukprot:6976049-Prymnesium_polylepis.1